MNILVLSPHRDDAAFSVALSISDWLVAGHSVTLLNVFTRSLYAPYSDADFVAENDRLSYVSAMRRKEDQAFQKHLTGLAMVDLNLKDAPVRLRCDTAMVCKIDPDPNDTAVSKIRKAITAQLAPGTAAHALVLPLALGRHVDHQVVRNAGISFASTHPTAFYEDLPYAAREGVHADLIRFREDIAARLQMQLYPALLYGAQYADLESKAAFKLKIASLYASQIDRQVAETIAHFSRRYGFGERLWVNDLWRNQAIGDQLSTEQHDAEANPLP